MNEAEKFSAFGLCPSMCGESLTCREPALTLRGYAAVCNKDYRGVVLAIDESSGEAVGEAARTIGTTPS